MRSDQRPCVDIIIPTYNRAHLVATAVNAAMEQTWPECRVTVVDDHGDDETADVLSEWFAHPQFNFIRLARNVGTAQAKNAGLLLTVGDAVTFHDSDDIPHPAKVARQAEAISERDQRADACLNWDRAGRAAGALLEVGVVLTHHSLVLPDGSKVDIRRDLSLLDDVFPNLQLGSGVPGEWTHINSGLFRQAVFQRLGGFEDCIEEDREFRNRMILSGEIMRVLPAILLTKIETPDSLTQSPVSNYDSPRRVRDRQMVWDKVSRWQADGSVAPVPFDFPDLALDFVSAPALLGRRSLPMTPETQSALDALFGRWSQQETGIAAQ